MSAEGGPSFLLGLAPEHVTGWTFSAVPGYDWPMRERHRKEASSQKGTLFIVSTPIGDIEDITVRALRVLKSVDVIAAEDPRCTSTLLRHYGIHGVLTSYHARNKEEKSAVLTHRLASGRSVALVVDTGTPLIVDPGAYLVAHALRRGIPVRPVPGPSAVLAALIASGIPIETFVFQGQLPRARPARRRTLQLLSDDPRTYVFFAKAEAIVEILEDVLAVVGNRRLAVAVNLTSPEEQVLRGTVSTLTAKCRRLKLSGDMTLVITGGRRRPATGRRRAGSRRQPSRRLRIMTR